MQFTLWLLQEVLNVLYTFAEEVYHALVLPSTKGGEIFQHNSP